MRCNYEILTKCTKLSRAQYLTCPDFFFVYMHKLVLLKSHNNVLTKMFSENPGKLVLDRDLWDAKNATD